MKKSPQRVFDSRHKTNRDSLEKFIARLHPDQAFNVYDWLKSLATDQLRLIEEDAQKCYGEDEAKTLPEAAEIDLIYITLSIYVAERRFEFNKDEAAVCLDSLMAGLAVAACIDRLTRADWVIITRQASIVLQEPRPYRVTQKGINEGMWSGDPLTLWLLGTHLTLH